MRRAVRAGSAQREREREIQDVAVNAVFSFTTKPRLVIPVFPQADACGSALSLAFAHPTFRITSAPRPREPAPVGPPKERHRRATRIQKGECPLVATRQHLHAILGRRFPHQVL